MRPLSAFVKRGKLIKILLLAGAAVGACSYVKSRPLVFNMGLLRHEHCMTQAGIAFQLYAERHGGSFPQHTNGYGDALLMLAREMDASYFLTGPGYDTVVFDDGLKSGEDVDESRCGRVYVQGLGKASDARIAILFDKIAAPPDHCHFPSRLWHGYVREVCFVDGNWRAVPLMDWPAFADQQIELLIQAGFTHELAQGLYNQVQ